MAMIDLLVSWCHEKKATPPQDLLSLHGKLVKTNFPPHTLFYYHMYYSVVPLWTPPPTLINEQKVCNIEKEIHVHSVINSKVVFGHFHSPISNFSSMTPPPIFSFLNTPTSHMKKKLSSSTHKCCLPMLPPKIISISFGLFVLFWALYVFRIDDEFHAWINVVCKIATRNTHKKYV